MDKNPQQILNKDYSEIKVEFEQNILNKILFSESFDKTEFLKNCIDLFDEKIIFLDLDLLYSGYVVSGIISQNSHVLLLRPEKDIIEEQILKTLEKISTEKIFLIVDSFNGLNNIFDEKESARMASSIVMLLVNAANISKSTILLMTRSRKKEDGSWVLVPGGRQVVNSKNSVSYHLKKMDNSFLLKPLIQEKQIFKIDR